MNTITISKNLIKDKLVVVEREDLERLTKENSELRLAVKAILEGELAFQQGETRSFKDFLKSRFLKYAKN